jgi:hypothetical protein
MKLKVMLDVESEFEAYQVVSSLGFTHKVKRAELDGYSEDFGKDNRSGHFLKPTGEVNLKFREKDDEETND